MNEADLTRLIRMEASKYGMTLFRNNTGQAWVGRVERATYSRQVTVGPRDIVLRNARPFHAGLTKGSSDLIGWTNREIVDLNTGEYRRLALFTAVEVKTDKGRLSAEQDNFLKVVGEQGGLALCARSPDDLGKLSE